jgi:hypothetical protein
MPKILLLGTSRLHRPFAKSVKGKLIDNIQPGVEVVFTKVGYFHTPAEILQALRYIQDSNTLPLALRRYVFRIEPRGTTPYNDFDTTFEAAIRENRPCGAPVSVTNVDALVIEVSSLSMNRHLPSGCYLYTNPNIPGSVAYKDLYPDGYYAKFAPELPVEKAEAKPEEVQAQLAAIRDSLPGVRVLVMGHLHSPKHPNSRRDHIHRVLSAACSATGCEYIDTQPFLDEFGHAEVGGVVDPNHLSDAGEMALGRAIQARITNLGV